MRILWVSQNTSDFNATSVEHFFSHSQNVVCLVCAASGATPSSGRHKAEKTDGKTCEKCNLQKGVNEFRQVQRSRSDVCRSCEEVTCSTCHARRYAAGVDKKIVDVYFGRGLYVCEACSLVGCTVKDTCLYPCSSPGCGRAFGHVKFDASQMKNHKTRGTKLHCHICKEEEARQKARDVAKEKALKAKLKLSRRKHCTCGSLTAHAEKCPMYPSKHGERPYPGCDVLTRDESDWLMRAKKQKRT